MQELFRLVCPVVPVAQPRQRHGVVQGRVVNFTPRSHPVTDYKAVLRLLAQRAGARPLDGPLMLEVRFYLPRPKRLMRRTDPDGPIPHTAKPDLDNLLKSTKDALLKLLWRDDSQVYQYGQCGKWYHERDGVPRVELTVYGDPGAQG